MDFTLADLNAERVQEIEHMSNEAIASGHPVRVRFLPRKEADIMPELIRTKINMIPAWGGSGRAGDSSGPSTSGRRRDARGQHLRGRAPSDHRTENEGVRSLD